MPKIPKTKKEVSYSLPIGIIKQINRKSKDKGVSRSQLISEILEVIFRDDTCYIVYELRRTGQEFNVWKYRAENHNLDKVK